MTERPALDNYVVWNERWKEYVFDGEVPKRHTRGVRTALPEVEGVREVRDRKTSDKPRVAGKGVHAVRDRVRRNGSGPKRG